MRKICLFILATSLLVAAFSASAAPLYVIADELNGRAAASKDASVECYFYFGETLDVVEYGGQWIQVKGGETGTVYVFADYTSEIQPEIASHTAYKVVSHARVNVRATPGGTPVKRLENGKKVDVSYFVGEWARIPTGWVNTEYLQPIPDE